MSSICHREGCGHENRHNAKFCGVCGERLTTRQAQSLPSSTPEAPEAKLAHARSHGAGDGFLSSTRSVLIFLCACVIGTVIVFAMVAGLAR